jgi:hypothetical protein
MTVNTIKQAMRRFICRCHAIVVRTTADRHRKRRSLRAVRGARHGGDRSDVKRERVAAPNQRRGQDYIVDHA